MKKVKFLLSVKRLSALILFFGLLLFSSTQLEAQSIFPPLMQEDAALNTLESMIPSLRATAESTSPNAPEYDYVVRKEQLYVHTYELLVVGNQLEEALHGAILEFPKASNSQASEVEIVGKGEYEFTDQAYQELIDDVSL